VCIYRTLLNAACVQLDRSLANAEFIWVKFSVSGVDAYLCCCCHPPRPTYNSHDLLNILCGHVEQILEKDCDSVIIISGDLNKLNCSVLESDYGLCQLVQQNTRGLAILDKFLTNRPDLFQSISVFDSIIKTDHKSILVMSVGSHSDNENNNQTVKQQHFKTDVFDRSPTL